MSKWVWFDMDGTIADLYNVNGWLDDLLAHNVRPYATAKPLYNDVDLLNLFVELKAKGYNIGIISWGSKERNAEYDKAVRNAKAKWLYNRCLIDLLDKFIVTSYGIRKADTCRKYGEGVLVDDEAQNRNEWDLGATIDAHKNIINELMKIMNK